MVTEDNKNKKRLYAFVKSKNSDSSGMAPPKVNGSTHESTGENAGILNEQFSSEFAKEDMSSRLCLDNSS